MRLIKLTAEEAAAIRGKSTAFAAIEPIPLKDGTYLIGDEVLDDPAHAEVLKKVSGLRSKPRVDRRAVEDLLPGEKR